MRGILNALGSSRHSDYGTACFFVIEGQTLNVSMVEYLGRNRLIPTLLFAISGSISHLQHWSRVFVHEGLDLQNGPGDNGRSDAWLRSGSGPEAHHSCRLL